VLGLVYIRLDRGQSKGREDSACISVKYYTPSSSFWNEQKYAAYILMAIKITGVSIEHKA
jgi:hypothetical protein